MKMPAPTRRRYVMTARADAAAATRQRIQDAAARLCRANPLRDFTLEELATAAATTVQTELRIFGSKDQVLYAALFDRAEEGAPLGETAPGDIDAAIAAIFDIYENVGDLVIRYLAEEPREPGLKRMLDQGRANHAAGIRRAFAPQIAARTGPAVERLVHGLLAATDVYVWKLLRRDLGLDRAAAETVMRDLLGGAINVDREDPDGTHSVAELVGRREPAA